MTLNASNNEHLISMTIYSKDDEDDGAAIEQHCLENENQIENVKFSCSTPITGGGSIVYSSEERNRAPLNTSNRSLAEFEEFEKYNQSTLSIAESVPVHNSSQNPILQIENLIGDLREFYNSAPPTSNTNADETGASLVESFAVNSANNSDLLAQLSGSLFQRQNDQTASFQLKLENELVRRKHCEKQIYELNQRLLESQQQLAISNELDKKRQLFYKKVESYFRKVSDEWKTKEHRLEANITELKHEKQNILNNQSKLLMKNQLLEQEMKKLGEDLINEKVKSQNFNNQINELKSQLAEVENAKGELVIKNERSEKTINTLVAEKNACEEQIAKLKSDFEKLKVNSEANETNLNAQLDQHKSNLQLVNKKYDNIKIEYEKLIKEAKMVVEDSEKQYCELSKLLEAERMAKDSLQVEMNMLEEKYENTIKSLSAEYETKISRLQTFANEKEKILKEEHKVEKEQLISKNRIENEKLKSKYYDDLQTNIDEYENKLTDLRLKLDTHRNEIERLQRVNKDLEADRNSIRQNLKNMLEVQMKETFQLLGIQNQPNSNITTNNNNNNNHMTTSMENLQNHYHNRYTTHSASIESAKSASNLNTRSLTEQETTLSKSLIASTTDELNNILNTYRSNMSRQLTESNEPLSARSFPPTNNPNLKTSSPKQQQNPPLSVVKHEKHLNDESTTSASNSIAELISSIDSQSHKQSTSTANAEIKDEFILNQIDLINKYYQIDNRTLVAVKTITSNTTANMSNSNLSLNTSGNGGKQANNLITRSASNMLTLDKGGSSKPVVSSGENPPTTTRTTELKHYIQLLLNRSPSNVNEAEAATKSQKLNESSCSLSESNSISDNEKRPEGADYRNGGDLSDLELGYTKRESKEYYDDVKRNLNFDDDEDDDDDENDEDKPVGDYIESDEFNEQSKGRERKVRINLSEERPNLQQQASKGKSKKLTKRTTKSSGGLGSSDRTNSMISLSSIASSSYSNLNTFKNKPIKSSLKHIPANLANNPIPSAGQRKVWK